MVALRGRTLRAAASTWRPHRKSLGVASVDSQEQGDRPLNRPWLAEDMSALALVGENHFDLIGVELEAFGLLTQDRLRFFALRIDPRSVRLHGVQERFGIGRGSQRLERASFSIGRDL